MNGLCLDTKNEYRIKIKHREFKISEESYEALKEIVSGAADIDHDERQK